MLTMQFSWNDLPKPFFVLAPMEGATDAPFRQVVARCGKPDVMFTEFVNVEGLASPKGSKILERMLLFEPDEQPLIVQLWGLNPDNYYAVSKDMVKRGFAGVDINMGCPVNTVVKKGCCSGLINTPDLAKAIIEAVKAGVDGQVPVSVKTRIGFRNIITEDWIGFLLEQKLDALTVHGRTAKEMSKVPAHWDEIDKVVRLRDQMKLATVIIGNGDVQSIEEGVERCQQSGVDGVMIGRGIFHNPWLFQGLRHEARGMRVRTKNERIELLLWHVRNYERVLGPDGRFDPLKRFFKIYIQSFDGASELREQLMHCTTFADVYELLG